MSELILENSSLLLMLEHFDLDIVVQDKDVEQICKENNIGTHVLIAIANLYNGFNPSGKEGFNKNDVNIIIRFLENSHYYFLNERIPEILGYINKLYAENSTKEIRLVENFFDEYSHEVEEHFKYEDEIAFPYFIDLVSDTKSPDSKKNGFSAAEYLDHHTDIETKLADLKELLLKHISLKDNIPLRRKLLMNLFELENNLTIHSLIEELILIPLIKKIEKQQAIG